MGGGTGSGIGFGNESVTYHTSLDFITDLNRIRKSRITGRKIAETLERGMSYLEWETQIVNFSYVAYVHTQIGRVAVVLRKKYLKSEEKPVYYVIITNLDRKRLSRAVNRVRITEKSGVEWTYFSKLYEEIHRCFYVPPMPSSGSLFC